MHTKYGTEFCIVCGEPATSHSGHLIGKQKMAMGNYIDVGVLAGFCDKHIGTLDSDENGCYGKYNREYGFIENIFNK